MTNNILNKRPVGLIAPTFILPKVAFWPQRIYQKWVQTLLKSTHLASKKSYLVIIGPNSYAKLTKGETGYIGVGSNIAQNHSFSPLGIHIWSLLAPIHMKSWPKWKLGKVGVGSNIAQNHSSSLYEVISVHYLPKKVDKKSLCVPIWGYLLLFCPNIRFWSIFSLV